MTENISQAFLGLSIGCAKCHNHPLEKWTNDQYYAMANLFARVRAKGWGGEPRNGDGVRTLFVSSRGDLVQPSKGVPQPPAPLDGKPLPADSETGPPRVFGRLAHVAREPVLRAGDHQPRVGQLLRRRLVDRSTTCGCRIPPATRSCLRPPTKFLVDHDYDLKALMRAILQSATYQASSQPAEASRDETRFYSHYYPRRLMAEVALDAVSQVTAVPSEFTEIEYPGRRFREDRVLSQGHAGAATVRLGRRLAIPAHVRPQSTRDHLPMRAVERAEPGAGAAHLQRRNASR